VNTRALVRPLVAALLLGCGAAGAPMPRRDGVPRAPTAVRVLRTETGWRVEVALPTHDVEAQALARPPLWGVFDATTFGERPPLARAEPGRPVELSTRTVPPGARLVVAAYHGRNLGQTHVLGLPPWTPPPAPPPPPLVFRRPDGAVELTWLPPDEPDVRVLVYRDTALLGTFDAATAATTDPTPGAAPAYRVAALGPDFLTGVSSPASP
jgi:hypothetical protein